MIFGSTLVLSEETHHERTDRLVASVRFWAKEADEALVTHANPDAALEALLKAEEMCKTLRYHLAGGAA